jgi:hypothetical protein
MLRRITRWLNGARQITRARRQGNRRRGYLDLRV